MTLMQQATPSFTHLMSTLLDLYGLDGVKDLAFNSERGTGQGMYPSSGISTVTYKLEYTTTAEHHFLLWKAVGSIYAARGICYAVNLQIFGSTLWTVFNGE